MQVNLYVEKHIFKHTSKSRDTLPKEYYSDVTYNDDLKALVTTLWFNKVKELLYDFSNGIINISEGTINNIYDEFSNKSDSTINNITNNILKEKIHLIEKNMMKYKILQKFKIKKYHLPIGKNKPTHFWKDLKGIKIVYCFLLMVLVFQVKIILWNAV